MPDVEDSSPDLVDPSLLGCCKAMRNRTSLHGVMVTALFSVIMFAYLYLYLDKHLSYTSDNSYAVASLVIQIIAYLALGCLYICNSSGWKQKIISAAYLVFVQLVFLVSSIGIPIHRLRVDFVSGTNIVAISSYCIWKFRFIILHSRLKMIVRTILHGAIVTSILVVIIYTYGLETNWTDDDDKNIAFIEWLLIQLVAYNFVGCLYICNSSTRKEKIISSGFLVLVLLAFLLSSFANSNIRPDLIYRANIVAISFYCVFTGYKIYPLLRGWLFDADAAPPRESARQQEAVVLQSITQDFGNRMGLEGRVLFDHRSESCRPSSSAVNSLEPLSNTEHGAIDMHGMDSRVTESEIQELEKKLLHPSAEPTSLPLGFLKSITNGFCKEQELGSGEYGVVYKGILRCGSVIAVKKFRDRHLVHDDQFQDEASFLMGMTHQNLVQLLGFCAESRGVMMMKQPNGKCIVVEKLTRMLCFEYVCNQGLDKHLSDEYSGLEWNTRYEIIKGICCGLNFLHERDIVHLDLKPQNILLDANMTPKIADFGLSRLLGEEKSYTITVTSNRAGTMGYMAPEYINSGKISKEADIFSLGVIIIEVIKGCKDGYPDYRQNSQTDFQHFTEKVLNNWRNRFERAPKYTALELHTRLVKQCIDIALECVMPDKEKRPNVSNIIEILNAAEESCYI